MSTEAMPTIDQKMEEMRRKNLEILKRHQEIEEDRQLAAQFKRPIESMKDTKTNKPTARGTNKNRARTNGNQQISQEIQLERTQRSAMRRKLNHECHEVQSQPVQRIDYYRLKKDRNQESFHGQQKPNQINAINSELLEYGYPVPGQNIDHRDDDEPNYGKKRVIIDQQANRIGSGRFNQQNHQRNSEQGQRRKEERMRRFANHSNGQSNENSDFHMDVPPLNIWQSPSMPGPTAELSHLQLLPSTMSGHHTAIDQLITDNNEQMEQSNYVPNFMYAAPMTSSSFNHGGTMFFTQAPPLMSTNISAPQGPSLIQPQTQFHQFHSNRQQYHPSPQFQSNLTSNFQYAPQFGSEQLSTPSLTSPTSFQSQAEDVPADLPPRFRRPKARDYENRFTQARPLSGDFDCLHNNQHVSSSLSTNAHLRYNQDHRSQARPQSFYGFSSKGSSVDNITRPSNNRQRYSRNSNNNGNINLPLSAYMNTDDSSYQNESQNHFNHHWNNSQVRRRVSNPQRLTQTEKHKFPLSLYDPRQYGFTTSTQKRNENNQRFNGEGEKAKNSADIDLIDEWWEDNDPDLVGIENNRKNQVPQPATNIATSVNAVNDSGNSSLSTSIHLKESTLDDDENNFSTRDVTSPPSDLSTTDSNIIESLDKLQQELKLEESVEHHLALSDNFSTDMIEKDASSSCKEPTTFDTAHFLQWAKEKFREELAGRLTAQQIKQHDAVATDDEDDDNVDDLVLTIELDKNSKAPATLLADDDQDGQVENIDELKDNLQYKLTIDELVSNEEKSITVE